MRNRCFLVIFAIYILGFFAHALYLKKTVYGDGIYYYSWLRSVVTDHDFNFRNEYAHFGGSQPLLPNGLPGNKYSVGPAVFWAPAFLFTNALVKGTGYELPYQITVGLTSVLFSLFGLILLFRLLRNFFIPEISILAVSGTALATNLFFYGSLDVVNSHALSFFAGTLFLTFLLSNSKNWLIIGILLGIIGLIRPQDMVIGVTALPFLKPKNLVHFILGAMVGFLPQLLAWQALYGKFWLSPYLTGREGFDFLHPHILEVLFALRYGLFTFSPILLIGFVGLLLWKNIFSRVAFIAILLELLLVSSWSTYWQGATIGGRMFVGTLPLFAFGLAEIFVFLKKYSWKFPVFLLILIVPLSILNFLQIFVYLLRS